MEFLTNIDIVMREVIFKNICKNREIRRKLLRFFVRTHNLSYKAISRIASMENKGLHPKHEIMKYYNFFKNNISTSDNVLDVGCGNGYVANKVSSRAKKVTGIDIKESSIGVARSNYEKSNIVFIVGDAVTYCFKEKQDVIILSNVLEHIEKRISFLKKLSKIAPKILIRVPLITRSWVDFYKKKKKMYYKLDNTHYIEYQEEEIFEEIKKSGLSIVDYYVKWGELYIVTNKNEK